MSSRVDRRLVVGLHPVRELLRAGHRIDRLLVAVSRDRSDVLEDVERRAATAGITIERVDRRDLDDLAEGLVHQGVVAFAPLFRTHSLEEVVDTAVSRDERPLVVVLDRLTDPHNLGSIARTAEAVGAHGLVVPGRRAAPITPAVEKAAAGALAHLPVVVVPNLVRAIDALRARGLWSIGLDGDAQTNLADHPLVTEPCALVVGSEGRGLARLTREHCDALVRLPMRGMVGSLNASVAAGVALYELTRPR